MMKQLYAALTVLLVLASGGYLLSHAEKVNADGKETPAEGGLEQADPVGGVTGKVEVKLSGLTLEKPDLSQVVISLGSHPSLDTAVDKDKRVTIAQRDKMFVPNFLVVQNGTIAEFPNWDHYDHNVFSRSAAAPPFDLDRYPYGKSKSYEFSKVGVVNIFCNIHPGMKATVYVTANRFFTSADKDGKFHIGDIPPGKYELIAWHPRTGTERKDVIVVADKAQKVDFSLKSQAGGVLNNTRRRTTREGVERGLGVKREVLNLPVVEESHDAPGAVSEHGHHAHEHSEAGHGADHQADPVHKESDKQSGEGGDSHDVRESEHHPDETQEKPVNEPDASERPDADAKTKHHQTGSGDDDS